MKFETICNRAQVLCDAHRKSNQWYADRYREMTGKRISATVVGKARDAFWRRDAELPVIATYRIRF